MACVWAACISIFALALRFWLNAGYYHKADAVVAGLMASDIASFKNFPLLFYGANYMGSIEAWITAPLFILTGPTVWGIGFAPVVVSSIGAYAFYLLGKSLGGERAGLASAAASVCAPFAVNYYNVSPRGCYPEIIYGGALMLWWAVERWKGNRFSSGKSLLLGFTAGLLLWTTLLALPFLATVFIFIFFADKTKFINRANLFALAGFAVGAAPFATFMAATAHSEETGRPGFSHFVERLKIFLETWQYNFIQSPDTDIGAVLRAADWVELAILTICGLFLMVTPVARLKDEKWRSALPITVYAIIFLGLYLLNDKSLIGQNRYLLPLFCVIFPAVGVVFSRITEKSSAAGAVFLLTVLSIGLAGTVTVFAITKKESHAQREKIDQAFGDFRKMGVKSVVWDNFEASHQLLFESLMRKQNLSAIEIDGAKYPGVAMEVEKDRDYAIVYNGPMNDLWEALDYNCGGNYKKGSVAGRPVAYQMRPIRHAGAISIPPSDWIAAPAEKPLTDRKFSTVYTGEASHFEIGLKEPSTLTKIRAVFGSRLPKSISIEVSMDGESWKEVAAPMPPSIFIPLEGKLFTRVASSFDREYQEWNFAPVKAKLVRFKFVLDGLNPYDMHELFLYRQNEAADFPAPSANDAASAAKEAGVKYLAANRYFTARLNDLPGAPRMAGLPLRPFDGKYDKARIQAAEGFGVLVDNDDSAELSERLTAEGVAFSGKHVGGYTLFGLKSGGRESWWTGFTLIDY